MNDGKMVMRKVILMEDPIGLTETNFATVTKPHTAARRWDVQSIEFLLLNSSHPAGLMSDNTD